jgi:hypothetical protein
MKVNIGKFPKKSTGKRKINIEIENQDTWNLDHTLALIIYPALLQLKATKQGVPSEFGDVGGDLFRGISQLLNITDNFAINIKSQELDSGVFSASSKLRKKTSALITVFMTACHFGANIKRKFKTLYKLSAKGGYLLIQDHDLPPYQRDKAHLYETFYNLYRILYNEISISDFINIYKKEITNYMTRYELMECVSESGFTPIGINILNDTDGYYNRFILLAQKR